MTKPIAILSSCFAETLEWACQKFNAKPTVYGHRYLKAADGKEYLIVDRREHIIGMEFSSMIASPNYDIGSELEQFVKMRIR